MLRVSADREHMKRLQRGRINVCINLSAEG